MGLEYEELKGSPIERGGLDNFTATMNVLVDWDFRHDFMREWTGFMLVYPHTSAASPAVRCLSARSIPFGGELGNGLQIGLAQGRLTKYKKAQITLEFGVPVANNIGIINAPPGAAINTSQLLNQYTEDFEPFSEFQTLPHELFQWSNGEELKPNEAPGKQTVGFNYVVTRHFIFGENVTNLLKFVDHVNAEELIGRTPLLNGMVFAPETLLFGAPSIRTTSISMFRIKSIDFTMRLSYRPSGWNTFWRGDKPVTNGVGGWDTIHLAKGSNPRYRNFPKRSFLGI